MTYSTESVYGIGVHILLPLPHVRHAGQISNLASRLLSGRTPVSLRNGLTANLEHILSVIAADVRLNDKCSVWVSGAHDWRLCAAAFCSTRASLIYGT